MARPLTYIYCAMLLCRARLREVFFCEVWERMKGFKGFQLFTLRWLLNDEEVFRNFVKEVLWTPSHILKTCILAGVQKLEGVWEGYKAIWP